jgi:CubicO group peptidase (beta-lactamase class C family)
MIPGHRQALQKALQRWQFFAPCPGANVTIIDSGLGMWSGASGYADIDAAVAQQMPVNGQCYIYSITKTFTAVCIAAELY